jgi:hypothetical protein
MPYHRSHLPPHANLQAVLSETCSRLQLEHTALRIIYSLQSSLSAGILLQSCTRSVNRLRAHAEHTLRCATAQRDPGSAANMTASCHSAAHRLWRALCVSCAGSTLSTSPAADASAALARCMGETHLHTEPGPGRTQWSSAAQNTLAAAAVQCIHRCGHVTASFKTCKCLPTGYCAEVLCPVASLRKLQPAPSSRA